MAKKLDDVSVSLDNRFERLSSVESKLTRGATDLPTISPGIRKAPEKNRRNSSVSMPLYVWDLLADAAHKAREPQNVFVMKALKAAGLPIDDEDLIDPRKIRYQS
jgi:hypothetical protein